MSATSWSTIVAGTTASATTAETPNQCKEVKSILAPTTGGLTYTNVACALLPATYASTVSGIAPRYSVPVVDACKLTEVSLTVECAFYLSPYPYYDSATTSDTLKKLPSQLSFITVWSLGTGGMTCKQLSSLSANVDALQGVAVGSTW